MRKLICLLSVLALLIGMLSALASCRGRETDLDLPEKTGTPTTQPSVTPSSGKTGEPSVTPSSGETDEPPVMPIVDDRDHPVRYVTDVSEKDFLSFSSPDEAIEYFGSELGTQNDIEQVNKNAGPGFLGDEYYFYTSICERRINGDLISWTVLLKTKVENGKAVGHASHVCLDPLCPHEPDSDCPLVNVGYYVAVGDWIYNTRGDGYAVVDNDIYEATVLKGYNYKTGETKTIEQSHLPMELKVVDDRCFYLKTFSKEDLSLGQYWYEIEKDGKLTLRYTTDLIGTAPNLHTVWNGRYEIILTGWDTKGKKIINPETNQWGFRLTVTELSTGQVMYEGWACREAYGLFGDNLLFASSRGVTSYEGFPVNRAEQVVLFTYRMLDLNTMEEKLLFETPLNNAYVSDKCVVLKGKNVSDEYVLQIYWFEDGRFETSVLHNPEMKKSLCASCFFDKSKGVFTFGITRTNPDGTGTTYYWYNPVSGDILCLFGKDEINHV